MSRYLAWAQLLRISALPTLLTNVLMGYWLAHSSWLPGYPLAMLLIASTALYLAGMVLNDVADFAVDQKERPERPLPSGRISLPTARRVGLALLLVGILAALLATLGVHGNHGWTPLGRTLACTGALVVLILTYNFVLKSTWLGPWNMGLCRSVNLLLSMSTAAIGPGPLGWTVTEVGIAGALGIYVAGITTVSRQEATRSSRWPLGVGLVLLLAGGAALGWGALRVAGLDSPSALDNRTAATLLIMTAGALLVAVAPVLEAMRRPEPLRVQRGVKWGLFSIPLLDAILCYAASSGAGWPPLVILSLAGIGLAVARRIRAT